MRRKSIASSFPEMFYTMAMILLTADTAKFWTNWPTGKQGEPAGHWLMRTCT